MARRESSRLRDRRDLESQFARQSFDPEGTLAWLEAQDPADAGYSAILKLNEDLELEIVVRAS